MRTQAIRSRENPNLELIAFHGHFATRHSHNSHYLDITRLKHEYSLAHDTALALANHYIYEKSIDTIICMDGSEVIGAFLARQLTQKILFSVNNNKSICVVTPEYDSNGQLLFRENLVSMIHGRNMLLLISTVNSGKTARRALACIQYSGGKTEGRVRCPSEGSLEGGKTIAVRQCVNSLPGFAHPALAGWIGFIARDIGRREQT